jgi:hypothetical protein
MTLFTCDNILQIMHLHDFLSYYFDIYRTLLHKACGLLSFL